MALFDPEPTWQERPRRRRALPIVSHDAVAADAVAGLAGGELIAALGVEAPIGGELCNHAAANSSRVACSTRRLGARVSPDVDAHIGLPYLPVGTRDAPSPAQAEPAG